MVSADAFVEMATSAIRRLNAGVSLENSMIPTPMTPATKACTPPTHEDGKKHAAEAPTARWIPIFAHALTAPSRWRR